MPAIRFRTLLCVALLAYGLMPAWAQVPPDATTVTLQSPEPEKSEASPAPSAAAEARVRRSAAAIRRLMASAPADAARAIRNDATRSGRSLFDLPQDVSPPDFAIHTQAGSFRPDAHSHDFPVRGEQAEVATTSGAGSPYIVQVTGPISTADTLELLDLGVGILDTLGDSAFVCLVPDAAATTVSSLPFVRWVGAWRAEYKLKSSRIETGRPLLYVRPLGATSAEHLADLQRLGYESARELTGPGVYLVPAALDADLSPIASLWWVKSVDRLQVEVPEQAVPFQASDSRSMVGSTSVNAAGYSGSGLTIGIRDVGIVTGGDLPSSMFHAASDAMPFDVHGTHVAGIIAGRGTRSAGTIKGIAPSASLLFRATGTDDQLTDLDAFRLNSVEISNHSYMTDCDLTYNAITSDYDRYANDYGLILVKSAGNENGDWGSCGAAHNTVTTPGTGKNVLSVGAVSFTTNGIDGGVGAIADYSSRGPTPGPYKRLKPELVAPGGDSTVPDLYGVVSVYAYAATMADPAEWPQYSPYYYRMVGTSMAAPHVTGALALLRNWSPRTSSSTEGLLAQLIAQAIPLKGNSNTPLNGYANTSYGYGLVNPYQSIVARDPEWKTLLWAQGTVSSTAREQLYTVTVPAATKKLKIALAYTDPAGNGGNLNDDVDFLVETPSGQRYCSDSNGNSTWVGCIARPWPTGVDTESPIEKMVFENPPADDLGRDWRVTVRLSTWPVTCVSPCVATEPFGLVVAAEYATPALSIEMAQTSFDALRGDTLTIPVTLRNTGGGIIPAGSVSIADSAMFFGPLIGLNASQTVNIIFQVPTSAGSYTRTVIASGVNLGLADATKSITFNVIGLPSAFNKIAPAKDVVAQPTSTQLSWTASAGAMSYEYCFDTMNDGVCTTTWFSVGTDLNVTLNGLSTNTTYYWQVRSRNVAGVKQANGGFWAFTTSPTITTPSELPNAKVGEPFTLTFEVIGPQAPYVWSVASGTLPPGLTFSGNVLSGTPTTVGIYNFRLHVSGTEGESGEKDFTIYAYIPLKITTAVLPMAGVGLPYTQVIEFEGGLPPYDWIINDTMLPPGLLFADHTISGSASMPGTWNFSVTLIAADGQEITKDYSLQVVIPVPLGAFAKSAPAPGTTDAWTSPVLSWTDSSAAASYEYCIDTINDNTCNTKWTSTGMDTVVMVPALEANTAYYWQVRSANVTGTKEASGGWWSFTTGPTITTTSPLPNASIGLPYAQALTALGGPAPLVWSVGGTLPPGLSLVGSTVSGIPTAIGAFTFRARVTAADGRFSERDFALSVVGPPGAFVKSSPPVGITVKLPIALMWEPSSGAAGYQYCYDTMDNGICDGNAWQGAGTSTTVSLPSTLPGGVTYYWQVRAVNAQGITEADAGTWSSFTTYLGVAITSASPLPEGSDGFAYSFTFEATRGLTPYTWEIVSGALPPGLTLVGPTITGTPNTPATASFRVRVSTPDGEIHEKDFTLNIKPGVLKIMTTDPLPSGNVGVPYSKALVAVGAVGPYTWAVSSGKLPAGILLVGDTLTGTPTAIGTSIVCVRVTSADQQELDKCFTFSVLPGAPTIATSSPLIEGTLGIAYTQQLTAIDGATPYAWAILSGTLPPGMTFSDDTLSGTPTAAGAFTFRVRVTGSNGLSSEADLSLTVARPLPMGDLWKRSPLSGATRQPIDVPLTWFSTPNARFYEYCVDTTDNGTCDADAWIRVNAATLLVTPAGLAFSTTYYWQVRAGNGADFKEADNGSWSSFTTMPLPSISVLASTPSVSENGEIGQFTVRRSGAWATPLTVNLGTGGSAQSGVDYQQISTTVTIPGGGTSKSVTVWLRPIDDTTAEGDETVTLRALAGSSYTVSRTSAATITIVDDDLSDRDVDLVISSLAAPAATLPIGTPFAVAETTRNQGSESTQNASSTRLYLSADAVLSLDDVVLATRPVPVLGGGEESPASTTVTIPQGTPGGKYYLIARADVDLAVSEKDESNNVASIAVNVGPDLSVPLVSVPTMVTAGTNATVTVDTRNVGAGDCPPTVTYIYYSPNYILDASATLIGSVNVPALPAGVTNRQSTSVPIPASASGLGTVYIFAVADGDNRVTEYRENNNKKFGIMGVR